MNMLRPEYFRALLFRPLMIQYRSFPVHSALPTAMRLFIEITLASIRRQLTYRATIFAGLLTNYFFGIFRIVVLVALYGDRETVAGVSVDGGITYMVLIQATIAYLSMFSWFDLMQSVYTGEIVTDLLKPLSLYTSWMARDLGRAIVQFIFRGVLILLMYLPFYPVEFPDSAIQWAALAVVIVLSWWVSFSWRFLINLSAFWTPNAVGIGRFFFIISWFFSGFLMPLRYYPDWVIRIAAYTPFPYMVNIVMDTFIGILNGPELAAALAAQAAWALGLTFTGLAVMRLGVRRLVILGG